MHINRNLVTAVLMTIVTTVVLGIIYPLAITGIAQVAFPDQANEIIAIGASGDSVLVTTLAHAQRVKEAAEWFDRERGDG